MYSSTILIKKENHMRGLPRVMILADAAKICGRGLLLGAAKYVNLHKPWQIHAEFGESKVGIKAILDWHPDGIIMLETDDTEQIIKSGIPLVICPHTNKYQNLINILGQEEKMGHMGAEYLKNRGFKNFGYYGIKNVFWSEQREDAYKNWLSKYNCDVHVYQRSSSKQTWIIASDKWDSEQHETIEWLKSLPKPIAIMACNDEPAVWLIKACILAGIKVPEEVTVLGVDNDPLFCDLCSIPLSSINCNFIQAGYQAAKALDALMRHKKINLNIPIIPTHIITRRSTDILAIDDPEIANAIHFIRNNADKPIQVQDVVRATNLSRCVLYERFKKQLQHSILEEIRRVRINRISELLTTTDWTISEIAIATGFDEPNHISRYFKKETGQTLLKYRKDNAIASKAQVT